MEPSSPFRFDYKTIKFTLPFKKPFYLTEYCLSHSSTCSSDKKILVEHCLPTCGSYITNDTVTDPEFFSTRVNGNITSPSVDMLSFLKNACSPGVSMAPLKIEALNTPTQIIMEVATSPIKEGYDSCVTVLSVNVACASQVPSKSDYERIYSVKNPKRRILVMVMSQYKVPLPYTTHSDFKMIWCQKLGTNASLFEPVLSKLSPEAFTSRICDVQDLELYETCGETVNRVRLSSSTLDRKGPISASCNFTPPSRVSVTYKTTTKAFTKMFEMEEEHVLDLSLFESKSLDMLCSWMIKQLKRINSEEMKKLFLYGAGDPSTVGESLLSYDVTCVKDFVETYRHCLGKRLDSIDKHCTWLLKTEDPFGDPVKMLEYIRVFQNNLDIPCTPPRLVRGQSVILK